MGSWPPPGPKKKIVFHCGGFAAAVKNIFFILLTRRKRVAEIFPPCHAKSQTSGQGERGKNFCVRPSGKLPIQLLLL
jgi:hypothetical protein